MESNLLGFKLVYVLIYGSSLFIIMKGRPTDLILGFFFCLVELRSQISNKFEHL